MRIIVIEPSQAPRIQEIGDGYDAVQQVLEIVGGYLQFLPLMHGADAYVDYDAKSKPYVVNALATAVFRRIIARDHRYMIAGDFIANTMVIVGSDGEDWHDLEDEIVEDIMGVIREVMGVEWENI